ncbi:MAG: class II aldolase/adducin family protein, partial [Spirochaetota bacterium]
MGLEDLAAISRKYGGDPDWVLAGGGNTSFKDERTLFIKASGFALATIGPDGFAAMDRSALAAIWNASYPEDEAGRESAALADLMAAREAGESRRPSVETLMHELFPYAYVVHTHPALINGITCGANGEQEARRLFGSRVLWVPAIEPGYVLATRMRELCTAHAEQTGSFPQIALLQNHGLVVAADTTSEIETLQSEVRRTVERALSRRPHLSSVDEDDAARDRWHTAIETAWQSEVAVEFESNAELLARLESPEAFAPLDGAFTPDHIVYAGSAPIYVDGSPVNSAAGLRSRIVSYRSEHGSLPRIVAVAG